MAGLRIGQQAPGAEGASGPLLRQRDKRIREERESNETTTAWAMDVAEDNQACGELIEHWRVVFDMQMDEDGDWIFDRDQTELWATTSC